MQKSLMQISSFSQITVEDLCLFHLLIVLPVYQRSIVKIVLMDYTIIIKWKLYFSLCRHYTFTQGRIQDVKIEGVRKIMYAQRTPRAPEREVHYGRGPGPASGRCKL